MNINKVLVMGNIVRDIELKALPSGNKVASFSIATNRRYTHDGVKKEEVEYHNVTTFGKQAEVIAQYCKKRDSIYVEGRLATRSWEKDGVKHYRTEVVMENFQFGSKAKVEENPKVELTSAGTKVPDFSEVDTPEDIPF